MMFYKNRNEKEAIKILEIIRSRLNDMTEYNAMCFAIDRLSESEKKNDWKKPSSPSHEEIGYEESHGTMG